jgi:hypothetical protein
MLSQIKILDLPYASFSRIYSSTYIDGNMRSQILYSYRTRHSLNHNQGRNLMSEPIIRACIDRSLPDELMLESMRRAVEENPANAASFQTRGLLPGVMPDIPRVFLAALTGKLWQPGRALRVRFLDGDPLVQERVMPFAHQWSEHAAINFEFTDDPQAEIRISFAQTGSWSYLGTDALVIPASQPTMNFGWLTRATANDEYSRVVIHEFGHALGFIHEHQNPGGTIPWNKEAVYAFYQGPPNFWTRQQVNINLFTRYEADITQFSDFDPHSIMLYPIPNQFTIGDFEVGWNHALSDTDKRFVGILYPRTQPSEPTLALDAPATAGALGERGQIDTYIFNLEAQERVRIETEGGTDVVVALFGPNDATHFIAEDDDSGQGLNARIITRLTPGLYTLRVRHFSRRRTGEYHIGVYRHPDDETG